MSFEIGDRVEVAFPAVCCGSPKKMGFQSVITALHGPERAMCVSCNVVFAAFDATLMGDDIDFDVRRLRKLPPLVDELDETFEETEEMIKQAEKERQA